MSGPITLWIASLCGLVVNAELLVYTWRNESGHSGFSPFLAGIVFLPVAVAGLALVYASRRVAIRIPAVVAGITGTFGLILPFLLHYTGILRQHDVWCQSGMPMPPAWRDVFLIGYGCALALSLVVGVSVLRPRKDAGRTLPPVVGPTVTSTILMLVTGGLALVLSTSCTQTPESDRNAYRFSRSRADEKEQVAIERSLRWLVAQQNPDGSWGRDPSNHVRLTSLATLAFLSRGEVPASEEYGSIVEKACLRMVVLAGTDATMRTSMSVDDRALALWLFSELWGMLRVPSFGSAASNLLPEVKSDPPSIWHVAAASSVRLADAGELDANRRWMEELAGRLPTNDVGIVVAMARVLADAFSGNGEAAETRLTALSPVFLREFSEGALPVEAVYFSSQVYFGVGGKFYTRWVDGVWRDGFVANQVHKGKLGWWTRDILGLRGGDKTSQTHGHDDDIYTTTLMLLSAPPIRFLPSYRSVIERNDPPATNSTGIKIEVKGI